MSNPGNEEDYFEDEFDAGLNAASNQEYFEANGSALGKIDIGRHRAISENKVQ